eukprot:1059490-Heterocapsa_arctica.AAC.1
MPDARTRTIRIDIEKITSTSKNLRRHRTICIDIEQSAKKYGYYGYYGNCVVCFSLTLPGGG